MAYYKDWFGYDGEVNPDDKKNYGHRLVSAIKNLKVDNAENTHRALDDAKATYEVLRKLFGIKESNFSDYINVVGYNPKYGVSGEWVKTVTYIGQYGGKQEIKKYNDSMKGKQ